MSTLKKGSVLIKYGLRVRVVKLRTSRPPNVHEQYLLNRVAGTVGEIHRYDHNSKYAFVTPDHLYRDVAYWISELEPEPVVLKELTYHGDPSKKVTYTRYGDDLFFAFHWIIPRDGYQKEFERFVRALSECEPITLNWNYIAWHSTMHAVDFHEVTWNRTDPMENTDRMEIQQLETWNLWGTRIGVSRRWSINPRQAHMLIVKAFKDLFVKGEISPDSPQ